MGGTLHRAAWIVPVSGPPVEDGAVLTEGGYIRDSGRFSDLARTLPSRTAVKDHGDAAVIPGLVNAHTHLELGFLRGRIPLPQPSYAAWVKRLFEQRPKAGSGAVKESFSRGMALLRDSGTALVGDIFNGPVIGPTPGGEVFPARAAFLEFLRFDASGLDEAVGAGFMDEFSVACGGDRLLSTAAHSCYAASEEVIREARALARFLGRPFCIHVAEHEEEMRFLRDGTGFCGELLERLGRSNSRWSPPGKSPFSFLDDMGVLDAGTLLVHAVHAEDGDLDLVARRGASICTCPRSNANLGATPPDPARAVARGIRVALGTDSLASNTDLNLFSEMAFLLDRFPGLAPETALHMATLGGAGALGLDTEYGSIDTRKRDALLAVPLPAGTDRSKLIPTVVERGTQGVLRWINAPVPG